MKYPLLRRFRLAELDREVARASMQICHKIVMQQLYISRANVSRQWVVISNPSEETIDLTGYSVASTDGSSMFHFPRKYTLLAGDQVTIWCSPGGVDLDTDNVLEPYLFWMQPGGSLRNASFFTPGTTNEVLLLDPMMTEVASLKIYEDGRKEFRVLNCISQHPTTKTTAATPPVVHASRSSVRDTQFCIGCLSPAPELQDSKKNRARGDGNGGSSSSDDVYVFSRYWDVVSDKSLFAHFLGIVIAPLVECVRALLIYLLLAIFQEQHQRYQSIVALGVGSSSQQQQLRTKLVRIIVLMTACDVLTRRMTLWIKSGLLVTVMSYASVLLDQLALVALYTSLEKLYPALAFLFRSLLSFELGIAVVNMAAIQLGFLEFRDQWHPVFKEVSRWDYHFRYGVFLCGVGKELLIHLLLLLPFLDSQRQDQQQETGLLQLVTLATVCKVVAFVLVPLFTISTGIDFVRGVATLLHLLQYPWLAMKRQTSGGDERELRGAATMTSSGRK